MLRCTALGIVMCWGVHSASSTPRALHCVRLAHLFSVFLIANLVRLAQFFAQRYSLMLYGFPVHDSVGRALMEYSRASMSMQTSANLSALPCPITSRLLLPKLIGSTSCVG